jgi:outer membrane receptor for ferrienterochelin and colicin
VVAGRTLIALLALVPAALAQSSTTGGSLEGTVADASGARVPAARVTIRDIATRLSRESSTDSEGVFRFAELPPATYEVQVSHPGLATYQHAGVNLALGATVRLDVVLQSAAVTTQVTVTDQPPPVDPAQTSMQTAVDTERIEELPVESRNYLNFVKLAPGVAASAQQPGQKPLAPLSDSGFTFGGLRGRSNNLTIDGAENNDEYTGASRTELSLETVQEFQVVNSGVSAESGGASGGAINVITRVGANALHGDAFVFAENGAFDARNPFETEKLAPSLHKARIGVALGGPIVRDRTFYYVAFEQERNRAQEDSFLAPDLVAAVNRILGARRISDNRFPTSRAETEASAKINHQLTPRNSLMLRYAFTNNRESGDAFNTAGWFDASARGSSFTRDHDVVGALTTAMTPQSVGEFRFQFAERKAVLRTNDTSGPGVDIAGLVEFGRPYEGNGRRMESHEQAGYTYSYARGHHLWKAGVAVNRVHEDAAMADGFGGYAMYANLAAFAAGPQPSFLYSFRQAYGNPATNYAVTNYGGFLQDHWSATPHLTVDLGLRYDFETLPAPIREAPHNFSPRIGIAWQFANGWVVRSAYGIFYDRYVLAALNRVLQKDGVNGFERVTEFSDTGLTPSIYRADPNLATPYSQQTSFAIEHQLARDITASVSYLFVRGIKLARTRNINLLDPRFDGIYQLEDSAGSTYHGVSFFLNRRMSDELEFSAGYTFSKTIDDASDFDEQPQDPWHTNYDRALSRQDQRHRLVFNALWELPIGDDEDAIKAGLTPAPHGPLTRIFEHIELAPIFTVESGRPENPLIGVDYNFTLAFPPSSRPRGFNRDSLRTPGLANIDFRVLKYFPFSKTAHLDLVAEAFNLFNHSNVTLVNNIYGISGPQPGFLQPLAGAGSRQIQFSLDFEF